MQVLFTYSNSSFYIRLHYIVAPAAYTCPSVPAGKQNNDVDLICLHIMTLHADVDICLCKVLFVTLRCVAIAVC